MITVWLSQSTQSETIILCQSETEAPYHTGCSSVIHWTQMFTPQLCYYHSSQGTSYSGQAGRWALHWDGITASKRIYPPHLFWGMNVALFLCKIWVNKDLP